MIKLDPTLIQVNGKIYRYDPFDAYNPMTHGMLCDHCDLPHDERRLPGDTEARCTARNVCRFGILKKAFPDDPERS